MLSRESVYLYKRSPIGRFLRSIEIDCYADCCEGYSEFIPLLNILTFVALFSITKFAINEFVKNKTNICTIFSCKLYSKQ